MTQVRESANDNEIFSFSKDADAIAKLGTTVTKDDIYERMKLEHECLDDQHKLLSPLISKSKPELIARLVPIRSALPEDVELELDGDCRVDGGTDTDISPEQKRADELNHCSYRVSDTTRGNELYKKRYNVQAVIEPTSLTQESSGFSEGFANTIDGMDEGVDFDMPESLDALESYDTF